MQLLQRAHSDVAANARLDTLNGSRRALDRRDAGNVHFDCGRADLVTVDAWARRFISASIEARTLAIFEAMTHAIKTEFRYEARHAEGTQTAAETVAAGSGTCRDFAVLMMEALRSFGVATRFVTGYLYDDTSGTTRGGGSTHAWCNVYLPGAGWMEYDPTNGLVAGANLIRVGVARSASQALPISGGYGRAG